MTAFVTNSDTRSSTSLTASSRRPAPDSASRTKRRAALAADVSAGRLTELTEKPYRGDTWFNRTDLQQCTVSVPE